MNEQSEINLKMFNVLVTLCNASNNYSKSLNDQLEELKPLIEEALELNIGNENKQSITEWLIENALKGNNNNALIDIREGRTKSFKNTEDLFKELNGVEE